MIPVTASDFQYVLPNYQVEIAGLLEANKERILSYCFTNPRGNVTALKGSMPSVLSGTLTARFSRAEEFDVTELFWKEFVVNPEMGIQSVAERLIEEEGLEEFLAREKARKIIRRILDQYGDDSVREEASAYIFVRDFSVLSSMETFQHPLITGIEASTRYINWGQKENGMYKYTRPDVLINSKHGQVYTETMDYLFDTYRELWPVVWDYVMLTNPKEEGISESSYLRAIKGRVCDNLRKLLPLGIKTNFGIHADYRSLAELVMNLRASKLAETRAMADEIARELLKINPEFMEVVDSDHGVSWTLHQKTTRDEVAALPEVKTVYKADEEPRVAVDVLSNDYLFQVIRGALAQTNAGADPESIDSEARLMVLNGTWENFFRSLGQARKNRRHKLPSFFNNVTLRVRLEGISFGSFKDINRHRDIEDKTQPDWKGKMGVFVPADIETIGGEVKEKYVEAQHRAISVHDLIARHFPIEARRVLTHGTKTTVEIIMSLSEGFWIPELRSIPSGDPEYRGFSQMFQ